VVVTVITTLGAITPPVGATAFVVAGMSPGVSLEEVFHGVTYFVPAYLLCVALLMLWPDIVLLLPNVMGR
jgi:TRAP-type C4-dicarboxylate transport system permease large subunit